MNADSSSARPTRGVGRRPRDRAATCRSSCPASAPRAATRPPPSSRCDQRRPGAAGQLLAGRPVREPRRRLRRRRGQSRKHQARRPRRVAGFALRVLSECRPQQVRSTLRRIVVAEPASRVDLARQHVTRSPGPRVGPTSTPTAASPCLRRGTLASPASLGPVRAPVARSDVAAHRNSRSRSRPAVTDAQPVDQDGWTARRSTTPGRTFTGGSLTGRHAGRLRHHVHRADGAPAPIAFPIVQLCEVGPARLDRVRPSRAPQEPEHPAPSSADHRRRPADSRGLAPTAEEGEESPSVTPAPATRPGRHRAAPSTRAPVNTSAPIDRRHGTIRSLSRAAVDDAGVGRTTATPV